MYNKGIALNSGAFLTNNCDSASATADFAGSKMLDLISGGSALTLCVYDQK